MKKINEACMAEIISGTTYGQAICGGAKIGMGLCLPLAAAIPVVGAVTAAILFGIDIVVC